MTEKELKKIEAELERCGYKKYTTCLTSTESYAWVKSFGKEKDEDGHVVNCYQIAFRVWDFSRYMYRDKNMQLPLAQRLTAEEKERVRKEYANTYPLDPDCGVANILIQGVLERIFGKDFFKEEE